MAKRSVGTATLAMLLIATGCAGVNASGSEAQQGAHVSTARATSSRSTPASGHTAAATGQVSAGQLGSALLSAGDLPQGFLVDPAASGMTVPHGAGAACSRFFSAVIAGQSGTAVPDANVYFKGPEVGTILQQSLRGFSSPGKADALIRDAAQLASRCSIMKTQNTPGGATTYRISPIRFPKLGEATKALAVRVDARDFSGSAQVAVVRRGSTVMRVTYGAVSLRGDALRHFVKKAVAKWQVALP